MKLSFNTQLADSYKSQSQKIRVLTENWVDNQIYCPNCGQVEMNKYPNNKKVADFYCENCKEDYELKSKLLKIGNKVMDGAYETMIERLQSSKNPNLFLLSYNNYAVSNFLVVPKHFFVPNIIEKRKPLSESAERANWIGCNILLQGIPETGKIFFIKNNLVEPKDIVIKNWKKTLFLRDEKEINAKGWLLDIMNCVEKIGSKEFVLDEVYAFENLLNKKHPENKHIKDKIRQQLQVLRDKGYLEFTSRGKYRLT